MSFFNFDIAQASGTFVHVPFTSVPHLPAGVWQNVPLEH
jgi:hypothetical protein